MTPRPAPQQEADPIPIRAVSDQTHDGNAVALVGLSLLSLGIGYATSIVVARTLGPSGFKEYIVAIASLTLLTTVAEAGTGKFALQILPVYQSGEQWSLIRGYWRFSLRLVLMLSVALAMVVVSSEGLKDWRFAQYPLGIAMMFLPLSALAGVTVDFVMANKAAVLGALIARAIIPLTTFVLIVIAVRHSVSFNAVTAVACYGIGATTGAILAIISYWRTSSLRVFAEIPEERSRQWLSECGYFLALSALIMSMFRVSVIVLEILPIDGVQVAYFGAALESGSLILLISKSTDKFFQPYLSLTIERKTWSEWNRMYRRRFLWVGTTCVLYMAGMILFGKSLLRLYGAPFENGYDALCMISVATCIWTLFSLSPFYLKYSGKNRLVLGVLVAGTSLMALLTAWLAMNFGASGAALAFSVSLLLVTLTFYVIARRKIVISSRSETA